MPLFTPLWKAGNVALMKKKKKKKKRTRRNYPLNSLLKRVSHRNRNREIPTGPAVGKKVS
jgi:hypothetical protein